MREVLTRLDYFYFQDLIAFLKYASADGDLSLDITDFLEGFLASKALLEKLRGLREAIDPEGRLGDLEASGQQGAELPFLRELIAALDDLREAILEARIFVEGISTEDLPEELRKRFEKAPETIADALRRLIEATFGGDFDVDGVRDADELDQGTDPSRPGPF